MPNALDKKSLRKECLEKRPRIYAPDAAEKLAAHLENVIPSKAKIIAGYRAFRGEIDVAPALEKLRARAHQICLPVVTDALLVFRAWEKGALLTKDAYGIEIPASGKTLLPNAIIVPLLAFDALGHRLGYGSGYYDRTIAHFRKQSPGILIVGAAYAGQRIEKIPADSHDEILDALVTEQGVTRFK